MIKSKLNIMIVIMILLVSCSTMDKTDVSQLNTKIKKIDSNLNTLNKNLDKIMQEFISENNIEIHISEKVLNEIMTKLSNYNNKDIIINLLSTKEIYKKEQNILGIKYTNYVNIDSGLLNINIKSIKLINQKDNELKLQLELSGTGFISLSGKNTGISASIKSKIEAYSKDTLNFKVQSQSHNIVLKPQNDKVDIKTKFTITLFGWNIPWRETINLSIADILKPLEIPLEINTSVIFPLPDFKIKKLTLKGIPAKIKTKNFNVSSSKNGMTIKSNLEFTKD